MGHTVYKSNNIPNLILTAGLKLTPVSRQSACCHKLGSRLPLLSARPTVTFPARQYHHSLAGTKLHCLVMEAHVCEQFAQCRCMKQDSRESNTRPVDCKYIFSPHFVRGTRPRFTCLVRIYNCRVLRVKELTKYEGCPGGFQPRPEILYPT